MPVTRMCAWQFLFDTEKTAGRAAGERRNRRDQCRKGRNAQSLIAALDLAGRKTAFDELHKNEVRLKEAERIAHFGWWEREFTTQSRVAFGRALPDLCSARCHSRMAFSAG